MKSYTFKIGRDKIIIRESSNCWIKIPSAVWYFLYLSCRGKKVIGSEDCELAIKKLIDKV